MFFETNKDKKHVDTHVFLTSVSSLDFFQEWSNDLNTDIISDKSNDM